jgi:hypothetical protein
MQTTRLHSAGDPIRRRGDMPTGHKTKTEWAREGKQLCEDAKPTGWYLLSYNTIECAVFAPEDVEQIPAKQPLPRSAPGQKYKVERVFKEVYCNSLGQYEFEGLCNFGQFRTDGEKGRHCTV